MLLQKLTHSVNEDSRANILHYLRAHPFAFEGLRRCVLSSGLATRGLELEPERESRQESYRKIIEIDHSVNKGLTL